MLGRVLQQFGRWATKVESWWALVMLLMSTGVFTWLNRQWELIASQGWAATIIIAMMMSAFLTIAVSLIILALAHFRRPRIEETTTENIVAHTVGPQDTLPVRKNSEYTPQEGKVLKNKRIKLAEIISDISPVVEDYVFDTCIIYGPAMILMNGGQFLPKTRIMDTDDDVENILVEIEEKRKVGGVVQLNNCVFKNCTFRWIGFIGSPENIESLRKLFKKG